MTQTSPDFALVQDDSLIAFIFVIQITNYNYNDDIGRPSHVIVYSLL